MKKITKVLAGIATAGVLALGAGCTSDADRVSYNIDQGAENFEIQRTIVFINGITDNYLAVVEGRCSIERTQAEGEAAKMQAICKVGPNAYTRDEIGLSDNVTYMALQTTPTDADPYHKRIILKPQNALPEFDVQVGQR